MLVTQIVKNKKQVLILTNTLVALYVIFIQGNEAHSRTTLQLNILVILIWASYNIENFLQISVGHDIELKVVWHCGFNRVYILYSVNTV